MCPVSSLKRVTKDFLSRSEKGWLYDKIMGTCNIEINAHDYSCFYFLFFLFLQLDFRQFQTNVHNSKKTNQLLILFLFQSRILDTYNGFYFRQHLRQKPKHNFAQNASSSNEINFLLIHENIFNVISNIFFEIKLSPSSFLSIVSQNLKMKNFFQLEKYEML